MLCLTFVLTWVLLSCLLPCNLQNDLTLLFGHYCHTRVTGRTKSLVHADQNGLRQPELRSAEQYLLYEIKCRYYWLWGILVSHMIPCESRMNVVCLEKLITKPPGLIRLHSVGSLDCAGCSPCILLWVHNT